MTDSMEHRGPADRTRINVNEDYELRYWSEKFGCTTDELKGAVKAVGVSVEDIKKHLKVR